MYDPEVSEALSTTDLQQQQLQVLAALMFLTEQHPNTQQWYTLQHLDVSCYY